MAYYLQMDGVDDYLKLPSLTFNKIVADVVVRRRTDIARFVWDFRSGIGFAYLQQTTGGVDAWGTGTFKVNGTTQTNNTACIPNGTRATLEHSFSAAGTDDGNIFTNNGVSANTQISGDIYDIKIYNGATLVAHYDMTIGNVQDQSGNGFHATLTGGTWITDGTGGGTAYTASLSDSLAPSDTISKRLSVAVVDVVSASETESERTSKALGDTITAADGISRRTQRFLTLSDSVGASESVSATKGKALNVSDSLAIADSIRKALTLVKSDVVSASETERDAIQRHLTDAFTQSDAIIVTGGKAVLLADGLALTDTAAMKTLSRAIAESLGITDSVGRSASIRFYDVMLTADSVTTYVPNAPIYIQKIPFNIRIKRVIPFDTGIVRNKNFDTRI
jgi:hypothetical protein